jgi:hypothetical protein
MIPATLRVYPEKNAFYQYIGIECYANADAEHCILFYIKNTFKSIPHFGFYIHFYI